VFRQFEISFFNWHIFPGASNPFVGWSNYTKAFEDPNVRTAVRDVVSRPTFNGMLWIEAANPAERTVHLYQWTPFADRTSAVWLDQLTNGRALPTLPSGGLRGDDIDDARDRLVRLGAACVKAFFDPAILGAQRRGSSIVVRRLP